MIEPRLFVCSGARIVPGDAVAAGRRLVELDSVGSKANVNIRFENVAKVFNKHLSPRLIDLLEIASYVFSADCATNRFKIRAGTRRAGCDPAPGLDAVWGCYRENTGVNFARDVLDRLPPGEVALVELARDGSRREWTFAEVSDRSARLAVTLRARGIDRGDVVMTLIGNRPEWVIAMCACFRIGAVVLPCTEQLRAKDLRLRLAVAKPSLILADISEKRR